MLVALMVGAALGNHISSAQGVGRANRAPAQPTATAPAQNASPYNTEVKIVMTNPTDAIAVVNSEIITRQQLSDECVVRKGEEILQTMINRRLIEQALRVKKLEVTAAEIDAEINQVAMKVGGLGREAWLRTLAKERGISPVQYARDIIYPALALRKLASPRVQVTEKDIQIAVEAQYGDKIRVRLIMTDTLPKAREIWQRVHDNPGGFEKVAQEVSMDQGSRALGGLVGEPIARHAYPQTVSDAAFRQLVDGDPGDRDPAHKPKDGDITGPIQVAEATWVILRRESLVPAQKVDAKDQSVRRQAYDMIYEVKLKEAMSATFDEIFAAARIENKLVGQTKEAEQDAIAGGEIDSDVKLMGAEAQLRTKANATARLAPPSNGKPAADAAPVGAPDDDPLTKQAEAIRKAPIK
jgi:foldase protein PrsA